MEASRDLGQPVAAQTQTLMADLEQVRAVCWRQAGSRWRRLPATDGERHYGKCGPTVFGVRGIITTNIELHRFFLQSPLLLMLQLDGRRAQLRRRGGHRERRLAVCSPAGVGGQPQHGGRGAQGGRQSARGAALQLAKMLEEE